MPSAFLSEEWVREANALRTEFDAGEAPLSEPVRLNLVVTSVPFGSGALEASVDTTSGQFVLELGHLTNADLTVTVGYPVARSILAEGNAQAAMQAFITGGLRVEGDISKVMALQSIAPGAAASELVARLRAITT
jgi:SCP-2 sterol transfer family